MKRAIPVVAFSVLAILIMVLSGCEGLLPEPKTEMEQVLGFLTAASADPQSPSAMKAYFDDATAQQVNMELASYWATTFFVEGEGPFNLVGGTVGSADPDFPGSVTVTGNVTNFVNTTTGYPAVFVLLTDTETFFADPLIRKITVTVPGPNDPDTGDPTFTEEVIQSVVPR